MSDCADRRRRWLAIAEEAVVPTDSGGRVESLGLLRAALRSGVDLTVVVPGLHDVEAEEAHRAALPGAEIVAVSRTDGVGAHLTAAPYVFASRRLSASDHRRLVRVHRVRPWSALLAVSFRTAETGARLAEELGIPLVVRAHNIESDYFAELARMSRGPRRIAYLWESVKLRRAEAALHRSDRVTVFADISAADAERRRARTRRPVLYVPPFLNGPVVTDDVDEPPGGRVILFVGSLDNANNVTGLRWFLERCLPLLDGEADVHVVGRRASGHLRRELGEHGVRLTADAPSVGPHLVAASVVINPVWGGSGVNIKMVEAMAAGRAVVSTGVGARGLHWRADEHYLRADDAVAFADAVSCLLDDRPARRAIGSAARRFVTEELDGVAQIDRIAAELPA